MSHAPVTVRVHRSDPDCRPPRIVCSGVSHGILWRMSRTGYTFTNLYIGAAKVPVGDFKNLKIATVNGKSVMTVENACTVPTGADYIDYKYTLEYTDPDGNTLTLDPTVRNRR